jgi:hypothetical protein
MAVIQGRTRIQLETAIGRNLSPKIFAGFWTAVSNTTTNTDTKWKGGADDANGMWLHSTSGLTAGDIVRVTADSGAGVFTHDALSATPSTNDTYILWPEEFNPYDIHEFINSAIIEVSGRFYDDVEDITLFADGSQKRFSIPSGISMIQKLQYRSVFKSTSIDNADDNWASWGSNSSALDTYLKKEGTASVDITLHAGASAGDIVSSEDFTAMNLSDYTHIEWWARSNVVTTAGQLKLLLSSTTAAASAQELLSFPALAIDTWTFCRVALAKADEDTAIISVGLENDSDIGAAHVWIDGIRATHNDEQSFTDVPKRLWSVDRSSRTLQLTESARSMIGYSMLKIIGGDKPALLSSLSAATEVPDAFIIARATALALSSADEMEGRRDLAGFWEQKANRAYRNFPMLVDVRVVE